MSKNQPFCDGSHHGTKYKPQKFTVKRTGTTRLCNCKKSNGTPFCDDTHLSL
jgi:CDGSH-type Zn-finger protein